MLFKECRKIVSKTDGISIMLSSIGDVYDTYISIEQVPNRFNNFEVIGFSSLDVIPVLLDGKKATIRRGIEFYLNDKINIIDNE